MAAFQMFFMTKGGVSPTAQLPASISADDYQYYPDPAYAQITINTNGSWNSSPNGSSGTWLLTGSSADCEVQFDLTGGVTPLGASVDTWLPLTATRAWYLEIPASMVDSLFSSGTIYIREVGGATLASCSASIEAIVE